MRNDVLPVSVVIPCYRCASTIERAVASVMAQSRQPAELILVDDASGDGTVKVLEDVRSRHPQWITLEILTQNSGAASARNRGWELASQPYVAFLDSDDTWHPCKLEWQYGHMSAHPEVALCGHRFVLEKPGQWPARQDLDPKFQTTLISKRFILLKNPFVTPSVMLKRSIPMRFQEGRRHMEDHLLWAEVALAGQRVERLETPLTSIYKPNYGASGLSGQMLDMQRSDASNYRLLHEKGHIGWFLKTALQAYSWCKFARRLVVVFFRRMR
jgi:glycosyltransferase involved in cell wall biosynthesis